jgi:hypothetical protein
MLRAKQKIAIPSAFPRGTAMSTLTVTTAADSVADDGNLSLREAVAQANATADADTIRFADGLEGKTLVLTHGELVLRREVTIDGDRDNDGKEVTLSGGGESRILRIEGAWPSPDEADVRLEDLSLIEGRSPEGENGGAILLGGGSLALAQCIVSDSASMRDDLSHGGNGGGIYAATGSRLALSDSTISRNEADGFGGGSGTVAASASPLRRVAWQ